MSLLQLKHRRTPTALLAVVMMPMIVPIVANAQTNLNARMALRPLTAGDVSTYKLPATIQTSGGMTTVAIGTPAYLEVQVDAAWKASDITGVVWTLMAKPAKSTASIGESPLPGAMPVFEPSDRAIFQVAGRAMLMPDVTGVYEVSGTVTTRTGPTATVAQTIVAGTYVGITGCANCHGRNIGAPTMVASWQKTAHAEIFTDGITGKLDHYASNCPTCHTVGFDNSKIDNGGFSSLMAKFNWSVPTDLNQSNWDKLPDAMKNVSNIQCENCHGPGSEHAKSGGTPWAISKPADTGSCQKCHDAPTHHIKGTEWISSAHAMTTRDPSGAGREGCVGCHTHNGFVGRMKGTTKLDTTYGAINCQTCHEPHGQGAPDSAAHLVRNMAEVKLADGTIVKNAGSGALCMNCHQARQNASVYVPATAGSTYYGPHEGPQADMLEGTNGYSYGKQLPSSAHEFVAKDTCVACHMQTVNPTDTGFLKVGGHTFKAAFTPEGSDKPVQLLGACQGCHGPEITTFDFPLFDYNGDGVIEGVQTEVQHMLDELSTMLPPYGKPKTALAIDATWTKPELAAAYNWTFVTRDGSRGVHNTAYAVALLKASIADMKKK